VPLGNTAPSPVGLPGEAELKSLLDALAPALPLSGGLQDPAALLNFSAPSFYFLDYAKTAPAVLGAPPADTQTALQGLSVV